MMVAGCFGGRWKGQRWVDHLLFKMERINIKGLGLFYWARVMGVDQDLFWVDFGFMDWIITKRIHLAYEITTRTNCNFLKSEGLQLSIIQNSHKVFSAKFQ